MLRRVEHEDIAVFFYQQSDPLANDMAAVAGRDRPAHDEHWAKILSDDSICARTIVDGRHVAGNVISFEVCAERRVGYWLGRDFWGRGIATRALAEYLAEVTERPLCAYVAEHNPGSVRVLLKCGFAIVGAQQADGDPIKDIVLRLDA